MRLDLKDFFLSGTVNELCRDACANFDGSKKKLVDNVVELLLSHQFVELDEHPHRLWRSVQGSGMGLIHSSDLMDLAYYHRCERWFYESPGTLWRYGIQRYFRFRDDTFLVGTSASGVREFVEQLQLRADYFKVGIEETSRSSLRFLDCMVRVDGRKFVCTPTCKDTSINRPLDVTSRHAPHVHLSWPLACLNRLASLSNTEDGIQQAKLAFIARFQHFAAPQSLIRLLIDAPVALGLGRQSVNRMGANACQDVIWCKLPYHPSWFKQVNRFFGRLSRDDCLHYLYSAAFGKPMPIIRVAWFNAVPSLANRVKGRRLGIGGGPSSSS